MTSPAIDITHSTARRRYRCAWWIASDIPELRLSTVRRAHRDFATSEGARKCAMRINAYAPSCGAIWGKL